jgi:hypothetical protein
MFSTLTRIELNLTDVVTTRTGDHDGSGSQLPGWERDYAHLSNFASSLTGLESLRLCFDDAYVSNDIICLSLLAQIDTSKLTCLQLIGISLDASSLASILTSLDRVTDLRLETVDLIGGTWQEVLPVISRYGQLKHLDLVHLRESGLPGPFFRLPKGGFENAHGVRSAPEVNYASYTDPYTDDDGEIMFQSGNYAQHVTVSASSKVCLAGPNIYARLDALWNDHSIVTPSPLSTDYSIISVDPTADLVDRDLQELSAQWDVPTSDFDAATTTEFVLQSIEIV